MSRFLRAVRSLLTSTVAGILCLGVLGQPGRVDAQGALIPPGAPAASMKSLAQVDPGTPISSAGFSVAAPGYYYLTGNLTGTVHGIVVAASGSGAVIDLRGFTISTPSATTNSGVLLSGGVTNVTIRNGHIRGHYQYGVDGRGNTHCVLEKLVVADVDASGLTIGSASRVRDCTVVGVGTSTGYFGLVAEDNVVVERCVVRGLPGVFGSGAKFNAGCTVLDCIVADSNGHGFFALGAITLRQCTARNNAGDGFNLARSSRALDCLAESNAQHGFEANDNCQLTRCTAVSNGFSGFALDALCLLTDSSSAYNTQNGVLIGGAGVRIVGSQVHQNSGSGITAAGVAQTNCTVSDCTVAANASVGIAAGNSTWAVVRNHLTGNGGSGNYLVPNRAPTQSPATATNPFANFGDP
ncbi:MAG: right-handed parallel beta-helix repeat-containing protein [Verrucomicrobia bacterium]|nr:right-handed parallel beta-helix repeat-containing protein [Verrucomicrobiota bacterium]